MDLQEVLEWGGASKVSPPLPHSPFTAKLTVPTHLQPVLRFLLLQSAGSDADCALRTLVYLQGRFPKVRRHRDGLPSQPRQLRPRIRPSEGVRDGSVSPARRGACRPGIGSPPPLSGNPRGTFLVASQLTFPASRREF